jgi:hypothetical protein
MFSPGVPVGAGIWGSIMRHHRARAASLALSVTLAAICFLKPALAQLPAMADGRTTYVDGAGALHILVKGPDGQQQQQQVISQGGYDATQGGGYLIHGHTGTFYVFIDQRPADNNTAFLSGEGTYIGPPNGIQTVGGITSVSRSDNYLTGNQLVVDPKTGDQFLMNPSDGSGVSGPPAAGPAGQTTFVLNPNIVGRNGERHSTLEISPGSVLENSKDDIGNGGVKTPNYGQEQDTGARIIPTYEPLQFKIPASSVNDPTKALAQLQMARDNAQNGYSTKFDAATDAMLVLDNFHKGSGNNTIVVVTPDGDPPYSAGNVTLYQRPESLSQPDLSLKDLKNQVSVPVNTVAELATLGGRPVSGDQSTWQAALGNVRPLLIGALSPDKGGGNGGSGTSTAVAAINGAADSTNNVANSGIGGALGADGGINAGASGNANLGDTAAKSGNPPVTITDVAPPAYPHGANTVMGGPIPYGHVLDANGIAVLAPGFTHDANGFTVLAPGYALDTNGKLVAAPGYVADANGNAILDSGYILDASGKAVLAPGFSLDANGKAVATLPDPAPVAAPAPGPVATETPPPAQTPPANVQNGPGSPGLNGVPDTAPTNPNGPGSVIGLNGNVDTATTNPKGPGSVIDLNGNVDATPTNPPAPVADQVPPADDNSFDPSNGPGNGLNGAPSTPGAPLGSNPGNTGISETIVAPTTMQLAQLPDGSFARPIYDNNGNLAPGQVLVNELLPAGSIIGTDGHVQFANAGGVIPASQNRLTLEVGNPPRKVSLSPALSGAVANLLGAVGQPGLLTAQIADEQALFALYTSRATDGDRSGGGAAGRAAAAAASLPGLQAQLASATAQVVKVRAAVTNGLQGLDGDTQTALNVLLGGLNGNTALTIRSNADGSSTIISGGKVLAVADAGNGPIAGVTNSGGGNGAGSGGGYDANGALRRGLANNGGVGLDGPVTIADISVITPAFQVAAITPLTATSVIAPAPGVPLDTLHVADTVTVKASETLQQANLAAAAAAALAAQQAAAALAAQQAAAALVAQQAAAAAALAAQQAAAAAAAQAALNFFTSPIKITDGTQTSVIGVTDTKANSSFYGVGFVPLPNGASGWGIVIGHNANGAPVGPVHADLLSANHGSGSIYITSDNTSTADGTIVDAVLDGQSNNTHASALPLKANSPAFTAVKTSPTLSDAGGTTGSVVTQPADGTNWSGFITLGSVSAAGNGHVIATPPGSVGFTFHPAAGTTDVSVNIPASDMATLTPVINNGAALVFNRNGQTLNDNMGNSTDSAFTSTSAFGLAGISIATTGSPNKLLEFGTAGSQVASQPDPNFSYLTWGVWAQTNNVGTRLLPGQSRWIAGQLTAGTDIPTTATGTYTGALHGGVFCGAGCDSSDVYGNVNLTANFAGRTLTGTLGNFAAFNNGAANAAATAALPQGAASANVAASWGAGVNAINGTVSGNAANPGWNGAVHGAFFGPQGAEVGGNFSLANGAVNAAGVWAGTKN